MKLRKQRTVFKFMIGLLAFFIVATMVFPDKSYADGKIHLEYSKVSMVDGSTYELRLIDRYGNTIAPSKITWKSGNKSVAVVNKSGKITAKKKGIVKISVTKRTESQVV